MTEAIVRNRSGAPILSVDTGDDADQLWTPADASGAGLVLNPAAGSFYCIGNLVFASFNVSYPVTADASPAKLSLPFPGQQPGNANVQMGGYMTFTDSGLVLSFFVSNGIPSDVRLYTNAGVAVTNANLSGKSLRATVVYRRTIKGS